MEQAPAPIRSLSQRLFALLLPAVFVVLWSTGFVFGKLGMPSTKPFTFLEIRYFVVITLLSLIAVLMTAGAVESSQAETPSDVAAVVQRTHW